MYVLVTPGGQFTYPGLSVPICTLGMRLGVVDEAEEVKGLCECEPLFVSKLEDVQSSQQGMQVRGQAVMSEYQCDKGQGSASILLAI